MKKLEELGISPSPWRVVTVNGRLHSVEASPRFVGVLMSITTVCSLHKGRNADARLIAAAPELYDVCFRIMRWEDYSKAHNKAIEPWRDIIHDLRAALAKAAEENTQKEMTK